MTDLSVAIATADPASGNLIRAISRPELASHTREVLSQLAEATHWPSCDQSSAATVCPCRQACVPSRATAPGGNGSSARAAAVAKPLKTTSHADSECLMIGPPAYHV